MAAPGEMDEKNVNAKMATATSDEIDREWRHLVEVDATIFHTFVGMGVMVVQQIPAWQ